MAKKFEKLEDAAAIITKYEEIIQKKKTNIICIAYQQRKLFKIFKEKNKFIQMVKNLVPISRQSSSR